MRFSNAIDQGCMIMLLYIHNTSAVRYVKDVYGIDYDLEMIQDDSDADYSYAEEKTKAWLKSPTFAIGQLDIAHMAKLFSVARDRYAAAAGVDDE